MYTSTVNSLLSRLPAKLRNLLHLASPSTSSSAEVPSFGSMDDRQNAESTPPPEEQIDLPCIWAVEFYTPSHTDALELALQRLGYGAGDALGLREDPIAWIRELRRHRYGGGSRNLGYLTTDDTRPRLLGWHHVPTLPPKVEHAQAEICSLSPSLIAIAVCFTVDESVSDEINEGLKKRRTTYTVPHEGGVTVILDPFHQKLREIQELRGLLRKEISKWFSECIPGVFCSGGDNDVPTWELMTAVLGEPHLWNSQEQFSHRSYLRLLGFSLGFDSWRHEEISGLFFSEDRTRNHASLLGKQQHLLEAVRSAEERDRDGLIGTINEAVRHILPSWAIGPLVDHYTRELIEATMPASNRPERALDALKNDMYGRIDISVIASELKDICEKAEWVWGDARVFRRPRPGSPQEETSLAEDLRYMVGNQATWLREADSVFRDNTAQYGTLLASTENIRLQGTIRRLTLLLAGLGVAAVVATVVMPVIVDKWL